MVSITCLKLEKKRINKVIIDKKTESSLIKVVFVLEL